VYRYILKTIQNRTYTVGLVRMKHQIEHEKVVCGQSKGRLQFPITVGDLQVSPTILFL